MLEKIMSYLSIIIMLLFIDCTNHKTGNDFDSQTNETISDNNIDSLSIDNKIIYNPAIETYELKDLKGAWFDEPNENGLFYIDDSIFYLEASQSYYAWTSFDSLLIDLNYDTLGFKILTIHDSIKLIPLNGENDKFLFRQRE